MHFLFYSAGHFQMTDGDLAGIGKTTAHRSVHKVTRAICRKKRLFLKFPTDLTEVKRRFFDIAGFPNVVGAIDCTHTQAATHVFFTRISGGFCSW